MYIFFYISKIVTDLIVEITDALLHRALCEHGTMNIFIFFIIHGACHKEKFADSQSVLDDRPSGFY